MALLPPFFLDCVVSIGITGSNHITAWIGTGFFYGFPTEKDNDGSQMYAVYLITNKHVVGDHRDAFIRVNPQSGEAGRDFPLQLRDAEAKPIWNAHQNQSIDLAILRINPQYLHSQGMRFSFFQDDLHVATRDKLKDGGLAEGDPVFILGFPMGQVGSQRLYTICRQGVIARCRDWLDGAGQELLVDSSVFPGNSGGPVVSTIYLAGINGTKMRDRSELLGVVQSYLPYQDVAISQQTRRPRIIFEENSGLASVIPIDFVREVVADLHRQKELPISSTKEPNQALAMPMAVTPAAMKPA